MEKKRQSIVEGRQVVAYDSEKSPGIINAIFSISESAQESQNSIQELSTFRLVLVLAGLWLGVLLVALDETMLATISSPISSSFNSFSQLSWILTTYSIGSSISQPFSGYFTDIFGRRAGLVLCYFLFAVGTLLCGLSSISHQLWMFLAGRVIQGVGGGSLCSITSFIESDLVPLRKRALIEGIGNVAFGATLALGGVYGGAINEAIGWKWAFLMKVPMIVFDAALVILVVKIPRKNLASTSRNIDYFGCVILLVTITFFQYGMNAGSVGIWNTPLIIAALITAGVGFIIFLYWDFAKALNPIVPIRLCFQRTIASSQLSFFFNSAASASILYYVPIYLQILGVSTRDSGTRFIPYAIAFGLGSFITGYFVKISGRYYIINIFVQLSSLVGAILLCTMTQHTPSWAPFIYLAFVGLGFGSAYVTRLMGLLSSADSEKQAVIQAASWTISSTGFAIGIAVASAVFQKLSLGQSQSVLSGQPELLSKVRGSFEVLGELDSAQGQEVLEVYLMAVRGVFFVGLGELVVAAALSFFMENNSITDDLCEDRLAKDSACETVK